MISIFLAKSCQVCQISTFTDLGFHLLLEILKLVILFHADEESKGSCEIAKTEYNEFYKKTFNEFLDPLQWVPGANIVT